MKRKWLLVIATVLAVGAGQVAAGDAVKDDLARLKGTWVAVKVIVRGKEIKDKEIANLKLVIDGRKITIHSKGKDKPEEGTFTIDPAKDPKTIDLTSAKKEETLPGIYQIDGDTLKLTFTSIGIKKSNGKKKVLIGKRPTDVDGKGENGVVILKRDK